MSLLLNKPIVSILMAGYCSKINMLELALDSIKNQTYQNFELIFVNDGCDDSVLKLIESYQNSFRIKILHNEHNLGLPKSLNRGLKIADGKYIARFDDDDEMFPERIEKQVKFLEQYPDYAGCWTEYFYIDSTGSTIGKSNIGDKNFIKQFVSRGNCCCHSSFFVRKSVIEELNGYNEKFVYAQDLELYLRILEKYKMYCLPEYLVKFRRNTTRNPIEKQLLSFGFSFAASLKYVYQNQTLKTKLYLIVRVLVMIKFCFIDMFKIDE